MKRLLTLLCTVLMIAALLLPAMGLGEEAPLAASIKYKKTNVTAGQEILAEYAVTGGTGVYTGINYYWMSADSTVILGPGKLDSESGTGSLTYTPQGYGSVRLKLSVTDSAGESLEIEGKPVTILPGSFFQWVFYLLERYGSLFLRGIGVTMLVAIIGTVCGFLIGLLVAILRTIPQPRKHEKLSALRGFLLRALSWLLGVYIEVFRGTPMMVQAMVIYYGLAGLGVSVPVLVAACAIVSVNTGAYMAEIIRGGIISVDKGQKEAAFAMGMTHWQSMVHVVLPQAVRNIMPSIGNEFVVNIKDSSVLNVISVSELFFVSKSAAGTYLRYFETFFITACIYLILTFTVTRLLRILEKKMEGGKNYTICGSQSDSESTITVVKEVAPND